MTGTARSSLAALRSLLERAIDGVALSRSPGFSPHC